MIRKAKKSDISAVLEIEELSFQIPWPDYLFRTILDSPGFVVYEKNNIVVGYVVIDIVKNYAHIANIAVHPKYRRMKIGSYLINWCEQFGKKREADALVLEVREKNINAQRFYHENGFYIKGIVPEYYIDDNAIVMEKIIS
jgi:ribosomal-protein-alanine N-acetyltransferase